MAELRPESDGNGTPADATRVQREIYRGMSPGEKLELVFETYRTGRLLALAGIRMRNPDAGEKELRRLWAREHLGEELFESVYGGSEP